ncbi:hypothetical protein [Methylococcus mesophilus]|uniref:hypothetical protein n=1 Tax=Methylococcus mesophilus TaxID=2993564 RepID=UPI00224ACFC8|nr:hypothetical protein [Methylococcus mesophilus]UZR30861.1 hypothetical protein OOT43_09595 [Methylococcus mesophilus]
MLDKHGFGYYGIELIGRNHRSQGINVDVRKALSVVFYESAIGLTNQDNKLISA